MTVDPHQSEPLRPPNSSASSGFVQIPHRVLDERVSSHAVLLYAALREVGYRANGDWFFTTYGDLQQMTGWARETKAERTLKSRCYDACQQLVAAKVLETERAHYAGLTHLRFRLPEVPGGFEQLPREVLQLLTSEQCVGEASDLVLHYLAHRRAILTPAGKSAPRAGEPRPLPQQVINEACRPKTGKGISKEKAPAVRRRLVELGLVYVVQPSGKAPWVALEPFDLASALPVSTPPEIPSSPPPKSRPFL